MNAVRDAGDRHFFYGHARPDVLPQPAADFAVQLTDAVRMPARAQCENRHAEGIIRVHARLSEGEKLVEWQIQLFREVAEVAAHHVAREGIVPSGHRCVRSENIRRRD